MLRKELLIRPEWVRIAVEWLTQQERPQPVTKAEADVAVVELRKRGRPKKEERENLEKGSVATFSEPGRGADYIKPLRHGFQLTLTAQLKVDLSGGQRFAHTYTDMSQLVIRIFFITS
jgi:hypothetical protein